MNLRAEVSVEARDISSEFFGNYVTKRYAVINLRNNEFVLIDRSTNKSIVSFKNIEKIPHDNYLIQKPDDSFILIRFDENEDMKILLSDPFKEVVQVFNLYVVVTLFDDTRKLIHLNSWKGFIYVDWVESWLIKKNQKYVILDIPYQNKKKLLLKEGYFVYPGEYDMISAVNNGKEDSEYVIVRDYKVGYSVIRLTDLKESVIYQHISHFGEIVGAEINKKVKDIVLIKKDGKTALMRASDFSTSRFYDKISYLNEKYASVELGELEGIMRLSDFKIAAFE